LFCSFFLTNLQGMGWGMLAGGDITQYLVVLTTQEAVEALLSGTVQLGTEVGVAVGPVGRGTKIDASASNKGWALHPAYSYAHSKGFFVGISLEGSILSSRHDVNAKFYGRSGLTPDQVLDLPRPRAAEPLYKALDHALATEIPEDGFRPSQLFQDKDLGGCHGPGLAGVNDSEGRGWVAPVDSYGRVSVTSDNLPSG
jgi:lipid-binding SYLF domain-containing protein